jgi:chitinase
MLIRLLLFGWVLAGVSDLACAQTKPDRVVLGYSAAWFDTTCPAKFYNYDALTYLARAFLAPHPDGAVGVPDGYFNPEMESLAREHHVKLLMSLGGEADNANNWISISRHPAYLSRFLGELGKLMSDHVYDGIDIDWEPSPLTDDDGVAYTTLLTSLRARFPKATLTTALPAGEYWISHFSWPVVCQNVDYVNVMVYDYSGGWGGRAAYASNLFPPGAYAPQPEYSVAEGMKNLIEHHQVPPAKLLMGMTFWASRFATPHIGDSFPVNGPGYSENLTYRQTMALLSTGRYREFWDEKAAMPYLERPDGESVVCYENPKSIARKCEYAAKLGCGGVMIWHVGADLDGLHFPLMDSIAQSCGAAPQVLSREVLESQIVDLSKRTLPANGEVDVAKLNDLSADQLGSLYVQLGKKCASLQDEAWQTQTAQRGK